MKKLHRLVLLFLAPSLLFVFFNVVLAGSPVSTRQASEIAVQTRLSTWVGRVPADQSSVNATMPITGLSITPTLPAFANFPTYLTATIITGTPSITYAWSFGDGGSFNDVSSNMVSVVSHTYAVPGTYTVVVTASDSFPSSITQAISLTVVAPRQVHLPIVLKDSIPRPDLICSLSLDPPDPSSEQMVLIMVQIQNQGQAAADGFWVDLYINPTTAPAPGNLFPWQDVCDPSFCKGLAWSISDTPLLPGDSRTLISVRGDFHPNGYDPIYSNWDGSFPVGTYDLYAYADSIDNPVLEDTDGAVLESDETNNRCEILGLVVPVFNLLEIDGPRPNKLPVRPTPQLRKETF